MNLLKELNGAKNSLVRSGYSNIKAEIKFYQKVIKALPIRYIYLPVWYKLYTRNVKFPALKNIGNYNIFRQPNYDTCRIKDASAYQTN